MDNFYRLAYTLSAHLRNDKMITGSTFLENLIDDEWVNEVSRGRYEEAS